MPMKSERPLSTRVVCNNHECDWFGRPRQMFWIKLGNGLYQPPLGVLCYCGQPVEDAPAEVPSGS